MYQRSKLVAWDEAAIASNLEDPAGWPGDGRGRGQGSEVGHQRKDLDESPYTDDLDKGESHESLVPSTPTS